MARPTTAPDKQQPDEKPKPPEGFREGSRWIHERPPGKEVADWFTDNVRLHEDMDPVDYVTGVVVIPAIENQRLYKADGQGGGVEVWEKRQTFTPYIKVETRVDYFWKLMDKRDLVGVVEPAPVRKLDTPGYFNLHLPDGYFMHPVQVDATNFVTFIGMSYRVLVYARDARSGGRGRLVMEPAFGTKMVPVLGRYGPDENMLEKAQTGAMGRALGMAGMLVLPGSGIATAEDMEATAPAGQQPTPTAALPATPGQQEPDQEPQRTLQLEATELLARLESEAPEKAEEFHAWAKEVAIDLAAIADLPDAKARGLVRALEKKLGQQ